MNHEEFDKVLLKRIDRIKEVLSSKAKEYSTGSDRLHNFKRAAAMLRVTPEKALIGMFTKHMISILDMVDDLDRDKHATLEAWNEKLGDAVNYLILLEALVVDGMITRVDRDLQNEPHV